MQPHTHTHTITHTLRMLREVGSILCDTGPQDGLATKCWRVDGYTGCECIQHCPLPKLVDWYVVLVPYLLALLYATQAPVFQTATEHVE